MSQLRSNFIRRNQRNRYTLRQKNKNKRLRLSVYRSGQHIYVQLIDDVKGATIASASSIEKELRNAQKNKLGGTVAVAAEVGKLVATRALKLGVKDVCFDRGGYLYHGRIKALADAAREAGLNF